MIARIVSVGSTVLAITLMILGLYLVTKLPKKTEVRYNCELAEISPDFPAEVREQCRKLRGQQ